MADYQKMYYILFNAMSESCERMLTAIHEAEELYLDESNTHIKLVSPTSNEILFIHNEE